MVSSHMVIIGRRVALVLVAVAWAFGVASLAQGPLTPFSTVRVAADGNGALLISDQGACGTAGPLSSGSNVLVKATSTGALLTCGGGGVAGSDTQIQFNDGGAMAGDADFTFTKGSNTVLIAASGTGNLTLRDCTIAKTAGSSLAVGCDTTVAGILKGQILTLGNGQSTTNIRPDASSKPFVVFADSGATVEALRITTGGQIVTGGSTPAVTDTTAGTSCGTAGDPTMVGTDAAGTVTVGAGGGTSCTVTFATAWTNKPQCIVNNNTTANLARGTPTTTTLIVAGTFVAADEVAYICVGR